MARLDRRFQSSADTGTPETAATRDDASPSAVPASGYAFLEPPNQSGCLGRLGSCRIVKELGAGGMGIVFLAEDTVLNRRVAIKVMRPEIAARPGARERFLREARAAAALEHQHIVPIYQVGEASGAVPFIVMPFLAGESLADRLQRDGALPIAEVLRIGRETARGLAAAHAVGLIHRDIKPDNLWLYDPSYTDSAAQRGQVKILDFGLARDRTGAEIELTQPGALLGTPAYMSPEQSDGKPVDTRSDLFSLGCVLYQAATGQRAFQGKTLTAVLRAIADDQPVPPHVVRPEVPLPLSDLIMKLLAKSPDDRTASAREVAGALHDIEGKAPMPDTVSESPTAPQSSGPVSRSRATKTGKRRPVLSIAIGRWRLALWAIAPALLLMFAMTFNWQLGSKESMPFPRTRVEYSGSVDVSIWSKAGDKVRKLRLNDPGALPVHSGDQVRITARIEPAAYLYIFWIDSDGETAPIYPWQPGKWGTRPAAEEPVSRLDLPTRLTAGFTLTGKTDGMETLVLLARDTPLDADDTVLRGELAGLPKMNLVQNSQTAVWFENGRVVEDDANRQRAHFQIEDISDPVLRLQEVLREKLQPLGQYTAAVSFARLGK